MKKVGYLPEKTSKDKKPKIIFLNTEKEKDGGKAATDGTADGGKDGGK